MTKEINTVVRAVRVWDRRRGEWRTMDVDLTIDVHSLASQLAQKALGNKSRKSRDIHGAVTVSLRS